MRIRLLIDIETSDIVRLQKYVEMQATVEMIFEDGYPTRGRFVGAKEAYDSVEEVATAPDPKV